jgi:hypothetical protein
MVQELVPQLATALNKLEFVPSTATEITLRMHEMGTNDIRPP